MGEGGVRFITPPTVSVRFPLKPISKLWHRSPNHKGLLTPPVGAPIYRDVRIHESACWY